MLSMFILFPTHSIVVDKNDSNPDTNLEDYYPNIPNVDYYSSARYFVIKYDGFDVCYDSDLDTVVWTVYRLTKEMVENAEHERSDNFVPENDIFGGTPSPADYRGTGYDRGRLVPAADMAYSFDAIEDTFYMSNIAPQIPKLNRRYWKALEDEVRDRAVLNKEIIVVTGVSLDHKGANIFSRMVRTRWFGKKTKHSSSELRELSKTNQLAYLSLLPNDGIPPAYDRKPRIETVPNTDLILPSYFYKIIYAPMTVWNEPFISSFIFPNNLEGSMVNNDRKIVTYDNCEDYTDFETNIEVIEYMANIDFSLSDDILNDTSKLDTKQFGHLMDPDPAYFEMSDMDAYNFTRDHYIDDSWEYYARWEWYLPYINKK